MSKEKLRKANAEFLKKLREEGRKTLQKALEEDLKKLNRKGGFYYEKFRF